MLNLRMGQQVVTVHLRSLPLEVVSIPFEQGSDSQLWAVRHDVRGRAVLVAVSADARRQGVYPGMTASQAKATVPELVVVPRDPGLELEALAHAAELLLAFGPEVEVCSPNLLFVAVHESRKALVPRFGHAPSATEIAEAVHQDFARRGHEVTVVVAPDPDVGRTLAQHRSSALTPAARTEKLPRRHRRARRQTRTVAAKPPVGLSSIWVVSAAEAVRALGPLDPKVFAWTDLRDDPDGKLRQRLLAAVSSLQMLGVRTVADLARLPSDQLTTRFGEAGAILARRASGDTARPLVAFRPSDRLVEQEELEGGTDALEPVLGVIRRCLERLVLRLEARNLAVNAVVLTFTVEPGLGRTLHPDDPRPKSSRFQTPLPLAFARPTRKLSTMMAVAEEKVGGSLPGIVLGVHVEAQAPERDAGAQLDLFSHHEKKAEGLAELVGRLQATLGPQLVFTPILKDTHRPEAAWEKAPFDADRALKPDPVSRPRRSMPVQTGPLFERAKPRAEYRLPDVTAALTVTGASEASESPSDELEAMTPAAWPKPVPRAPTDEPPPPLPLRPTILFPTPERAQWQNPRGEAEEGTLLWRGQRLPLRTLGGRELLQAEWWTAEPLDRDYAVAEAADGRRLWIFFNPQGEVFVHGVFD